MNQPDLDRLIDRYYDGTTTTEEEQLLRQVLLSDDLSPDYYAEREMFLAFSNGDEIPQPSQQFESAIMERIESEERRNTMFNARRKLYSVVAVAASFLIVISSYFILFQNNRPADTFTDPQNAYLETIQALRIVSEGLNYGTSQMADLSYLSEAKDNLGILGRTSATVSGKLEPLGYIDRSIRMINTGGEGR